MRLRSLSLKLVLAFLLVGLTGAIIVSLFVGRYTQSAFGRFVFNQSRDPLVAALTEFYRSKGGWPEDAQEIEVVLKQEIGEIWTETSEASFPWLILTDADGVVLVAWGKEDLVGTLLSEQTVRSGAPIQVDGIAVGWLLHDEVVGPWALGTKEWSFLEDMRGAIWISAGGGTAAAMLLGALLARAIARPVRELTVATRALAEGQLGRQVTVRSNDDLGELARSFNRMSADLAQANRLRRQMTADIAHDLRTPLSILLGYTEALNDAKLPGTPEMYAAMHGEAQHLQRLIDDLRTLSLADAGELPLTRAQIAPRTLLDRIASAYRVRAKQAQVTLRVTAAPDLPPLDVDPDRMAQVLRNLIDNALRYTQPGGQITLAAEQEDRTVHLYVRDNGAGIAPEDLPYVFDRFYRGDEARRQEESASGLGLAIAKSLVQAHGGSISVQSALDEGTRFTVAIPL